jgi:hypothetical protein
VSTDINYLICKKGGGKVSPQREKKPNELACHRSSGSPDRQAQFRGFKQAESEAGIPNPDPSTHG